MWLNIYIYIFFNCDGSLYLGLEEVCGIFVHSSNVSPKKKKKEEEETF